MITDRSYNLDFFYHVPYIINDENKFTQKINSLDSALIPDEAQMYLDEMEYRFEYECDKAVYKKINRIYIGEMTLMCQSDSLEHEREISETKVYAFVNYSSISGLAILSIISLFSDVPIHFTTEEFYRGNGCFATTEGYIPVDEYMQNNFGFERCGDVKGLIALDRYPEDIMEIVYMSAAEEYGTQQVDSSIRVNDRLKLTNISQYEAADIYVNEPMVVCVFKDEEMSTKERVYEESIVLQIIECMLFKLTAINRTNRRVVAELEGSGNPPISLIEELNVQFASTIRFWDTSNFIYLTTRNLAYDIAEGFKIDTEMEKYNRNQAFLEHLINIRGAQAEERESTILSVLAIVLTIIQCLPVFYTVVSLIVAKELSVAHLMNTLGAFGCTGVIVLVFVAMLKLGKRKRKRRGRG